MSAETPAKIQSRKLPTWAVIAITVVVMAAGFATWQVVSDSLWWEDPEGSKACSMLADSIDPVTGQINGTLENSAAIAVHVQQSKTIDIREETIRTGVRGFDPIAKLEGLHAACVKAGVDMPDYR